MKKAIKILGISFAVLLLLIILLQFVGVTIGNVNIGKQKNDLKSDNVHSFDDSAFQKDILQSNKLTCINIWATWCVPCIAEMPALNRLKKDFKNQNVQFVSLSIDKDSTKLRKFLASNKFEFTDITFENIKYNTAILNFLESQPLNAKNSTQIIPLTYILKNGKVIKKFEGGIESTELRNEINKNLP